MQLQRTHVRFTWVPSFSTFYKRFTPHLHRKNQVKSVRAWKKCKSYLFIRTHFAHRLAASVHPFGATWSRRPKRGFGVSYIVTRRLAKKVRRAAKLHFTIKIYILKKARKKTYECGVSAERGAPLTDAESTATAFMPRLASR